MLADIALRRRDYAEAELFTRAAATATSAGLPIALLVVGTALGWGLVTNASAGWLTWQGYLLGPFGLGGKDGAWAYANLGVLVALVARVRSARCSPPAGGPRAGGHPGGMTGATGGRWCGSRRPAGPPPPGPRTTTATAR